MIPFGSSLVGVGAALIGVYAAQVKLPISYFTLWIIIGVFIISGSALAIIGIIRTWGNFTPRQKSRDERLHRHFRDMLTLVPEIIPNLARENGMIGEWIYGSYRRLSENKLNKFASEFVIHLARESGEWDNHRESIKKHNAKYVDFQSRIGESFKNYSLEVKNDPTGKSTFIDEYIFYALFDRSHHVDFNKFEFVPAQSGGIVVKVSGCSGSIAYAASESDRDNCVNAIKDIARQYKQETDALVQSANELIESTHKLHGKITAKMADVEEYWPGTREYKFKRIRQCPMCHKIAF